MIISGIDVSTLDAQFKPDVPGRVLVLDGDAAVYRATAKAAKLDTAYRRFITEVLTDKFLTSAETVQVHLTAAGCAKAHRAAYPSHKPYQGNRAGKEKPRLLEPLREFLGTNPDDLPEEISIHLQRHWEADDSMRIQCYALGDVSVVKSDDKDMRQFITPYWETSTATLDTLAPGDTWGWIAPAFTESGTRVWKGHGHKAFWFQMLAGDPPDNVQGITKLNGKTCAVAGALDFLGPIDCEHEAANKILWAYVKAEQNALAEAEMLWLRRTEDDTAYAYLSSLELDKPLRQWLDGIHTYHLHLLQEHNRADVEPPPWVED